MRVWPYTFELDLDTYRKRGDVPPDSANPYFHMFLLDDHDADEEFVQRHRGTHPMDEHYPYGVVIQSTTTENRRWGVVQDAVLAALQKIAADTVRAILDGAGEEALGECHARIAAVAAEHQAAWEELNARINEGIQRGQAPFPAHTWSQARRARKVHERNRQYGGGYSSGFAPTP
jgi:hypothetical protein